MSENRRRCPSCGNWIGKDRIHCPYCQASLVASIELGPRGRKQAYALPHSRPINYQAIIIIVLIVLIPLILAYKFLYIPWLESPRNTPGQDRQAAEIEPTPPQQQPPTAPEDGTSYNVVDELRPQLGPRLPPQAAENYNPRSLDDIPGWMTPHSAVSRGMSRQEVAAAWGEPDMVDHTYIAGREVERWLYADPLYGIMTLGRYVEFENGVAVRYRTDEKLEELYFDLLEKMQNDGTWSQRVRETGQSSE